MDGMSKEKWDKMTKAQKREHIWEYYKLPIVAVLAVIAVISWFVYIDLTTVDPLMHVIMTDMNEPLQDDSAYQDFLAKSDYEAYIGAVSLNQNMYFYLDDPDNSNYEINGTSYQILHGMISSKTQEILFSQPKIFGTCATEGALMDLSMVLPQELLDQHSERLLYVVDEETGEKYPCGVNVEGNPWMEQVQKGYKGYVGIINTADAPEMAVDFIVYFLNQFGMVDGI
ncbi:MAG: hypothetical protein IJF02_03775 [Oscillospiraceae bacterium]|nr:hypothetical protein [Oscillospiraceae bacterium]